MRLGVFFRTDPCHNQGLHALKIKNYAILAAMEIGNPTTTKRTRELPILTVSQLTQAIKLSLEATFPVVSVQGEISNFKQQSSGHLYFSIKDAGSQISAVMFRSEASALRILPKEGDQVVVLADLTVYTPRGNYQLVVRELRRAGVGELLLKLDELKQKLQQRGWFAADRKKPLPHLPRRIGVVTSSTGAVIQDILHVLSRRYSSFHLILNPVKVQGEGAAEEIARAIEQFNHYQLADVLIVGRGGGSIEDLWAFNEERVASAIFHSRIPIISAVGHETDFAIADFVADVRAPTPSAAAELVIAEKAQQLRHLSQLQTGLRQAIGHLLKQHRARLEGLSRQPLFASPYALLGPWMQRLDHLRGDTDAGIRLRLRHAQMKLAAQRQHAAALKPTNRVAHFQQRLRTLEAGLRQSWQMRQSQRRTLFSAASLYRQLNVHLARTIQGRRERLERVATALKSIAPSNLLARGYSILFSEKDRSVISTVGKLEKNQRIKALLSDGEAYLTVQSTQPKTP